MRLKLQGFKFHLVHFPGKLDPSDYTLRHPVPGEINDETCINDELKVYVNNIIKEMNLPISITEIQKEYENDEKVSKIMSLLKEVNIPTKKDNIDKYLNIWSELSVVDGRSSTVDIILKFLSRKLSIVLS